jgi:Fe-Mn family superoxide dismutase
MEHKLPELPYTKDALEPHISAETLDYHHGKHHNAYVTKLNTMIKGTEFESMELNDIIKKADGGLFNQAAQVFNHTFYWNSLAPKAGGEPTGAIADSIKSTWGSFDKFKEEFTASATGNFGSGWTWLAQDSKGTLKIVNTDDAGCVITDNLKPILTCDVWEHAYYIDYRNARPKYMEAFWNLVNWDFANKNLA